MAKESRFPSGKDAKVREMRRAETFLNIIPCHGIVPGEGNKGNWRAGCGESRTSGSEGGREKRRLSRPRSRPTRPRPSLRLSAAPEARR